jgi:hypothetical protein
VYQRPLPPPFATTGMQPQQPPAPSQEEGVPPLTAAAAAARAAEGEQVWEDLNEPEPVTKQSFVDVSLPFLRRWAAVFLRVRARRQQRT